MHECETCGMYCDCDGEDMVNPQPPNCVHLTSNACDEDEAAGDDSFEDS
jgi:hypothetical protein